MSSEYDRETCITVGELREAGIEIDPAVPDCAWCPRDSLEHDVEAVSEEAGKVVFRYTLRFPSGFRWVSLTATVVDHG
jgi:hypothetical protein